jgi:hypothetical protein
MARENSPVGRFKGPNSTVSPSAPPSGSQTTHFLEILCGVPRIRVPRIRAFFDLGALDELQENRPMPAYIISDVTAGLDAALFNLTLKNLSRASDPQCHE